MMFFDVDKYVGKECTNSYEIRCNRLDECLVKLIGYFEEYRKNDEDLDDIYLMLNAFDENMHLIAYFSFDAYGHLEGRAEGSLIDHYVNI